MICYIKFFNSLISDLINNTDNAITTGCNPPAIAGISQISYIMLSSGMTLNRCLQDIKYDCRLFIWSVVQSNTSRKLYKYSCTSICLLSWRITCTILPHAHHKVLFPELIHKIGAIACVPKEIT